MDACIGISNNEMKDSNKLSHIYVWAMTLSKAFLEILHQTTISSILITVLCEENHAGNRRVVQNSE